MPSHVKLRNQLGFYKFHELGAGYWKAFGEIFEVITFFFKDILLNILLLKRIKCKLWFYGLYENVFAVYGAL